MQGNSFRMSKIIFACKHVLCPLVVKFLVFNFFFKLDSWSLGTKNPSVVYKKREKIIY